MSYKNSKYTIILPLVIVVTFIGGMLVNNHFYLKRSLLGSDIQKNITTNKIGAIMNMISTSYVDSVNVDSLEEKAINYLIKELDPHTDYLTAKEMEKANEELVGNFGGVGVQFYSFEDTIVVVNVIKNGPSEKAGILAGDRIIKVNDSLIAGTENKRNNDEIMKLMRGEIGTQVDLTIFRRSINDTLVAHVTRGSIPVSSVAVSYMINDTLGFIKVDYFGMQTYNEFVSGIEGLKSMGMKHLIVDMRGNSGGVMSIALRMVNEFLPADRLILYTQGNHVPRSDYRSNGKGIYQELPITVLIDEGSASAAEIFAGALQDNDRAKIIGRRSFGKGLVQEQRVMSDGSALRLTIARYYIPSGRCIQKPYKLGEDGKMDYYMELMNRLEHGEFYQADSVKFDESQKFETFRGRTVYGGGGIMPDIFVPADTSNYTNYLYELVTKQLIYQYTFKFMDKHRSYMKDNVKDWRALQEYLKQFDLVSEVVAYASANGIKLNRKELQESRDIIRIMTEAHIARHLFDNVGFYPIYDEIDTTLQQAIKLL
ncbi:MAG: S41 family peptidase [Bacteroidales bacterium]|nr:S41 family peptidase [Bacteroidales bacterium]